MRQDLEEPPVSQPLGNALEEDGRPPVLPPPIKRSFNPWPWVGGLLAACALASAIYFLIPSSPTPAPPTPLETQFVLPPDTVRPFGEPGDSGGAVRVSAGLEAHLAVDGLILDKDLPMTLLLEEGNHNFFLTKPRDGIAIKRTVTVRRGESVELRFDLPPGAGRTP